MTTITHFKLQKFQALWLGLVILSVLTEYFLFKLNLNKQIGIFIFLTLTLGMYHGLLDVILLKEHQQTLKNITVISPILVYLAVVIISLCIFKLLPFITIPILLVITVWHFGEQQGELQREQQGKYTSSYTQHYTTRLMTGGASISLPFFLAFKQLDQLLQMMLVDKLSYYSAILVWQIISYAWLIALSCYLVCWLLMALLTAFKFNLCKYTNAASTIKNTLNIKQFTELCILLLSFYFLPLLLAFTLYFAAYHAVQHIADIHREHRIHWFLQPILIVSLATLVLLVAAFYVFPTPQHLTPSVLKYPVSILSGIIALLTAITIPHATLISTWRAKLIK